jgi:hypothetical protein
MQSKFAPDVTEETNPHPRKPLRREQLITLAAWIVLNKQVEKDRIGITQNFPKEIKVWTLWVDFDQFFGCSDYFRRNIAEEIEE